MQVVVVRVREAAVPELVDHLVPPRVFAAFSLHKLGHALHGPFPEEVASVDGQDAKKNLTENIDKQR